MLNIDSYVKKYSKENPDKLVLGWESGQLTYKELNEEIEKIAKLFVSHGITKGDRVSIILMNCPEFVISYYACMRIGAISVPLNPVLTSGELEVIINDCTPSIIIANNHSIEKIKEAKLQFEPTILNIDEVFLSKDDTRNTDIKDYTYSNDVESTIIYTSGTTGLPKGAMLTHDNLLSNALTFAKTLEFSSDERTLIISPVFHIAAQTCCLNATICSGGYCYLLERWVSSEKTLTTMEREKISFFFGPPTMYTYMLNDKNLANYHLNLRIAFTGSAALPVEIFDRWKETFGFEIIEGYGLSETSPVVTCNPLKGKKKSGSVGIPIEGVSIKIIDDSGQHVGPEEIGELIVKGRNVMKGYWNKPEENDSAFIGGWFRTGDIARVDNEGYCYIVDRKKDMINRSGFKIYPRQVEEVLYNHPSVLEAVVIGVPDETHGEIVAALLTVKPNKRIPTNEELHVFCKKSLATYKVPSNFKIVKEFPKTESGKVLKTVLRKRYSNMDSRITNN